MVAARRTAVLSPLVLLSASWTVSVADVGPVHDGPRHQVVAQEPAGPAAEIPGADVAAEPPASVALPPRGAARARSVATASHPAADIPAAASAAYQRAAAVIGAADPGCHLDWTLVAAIGRVESDHGRVGGAALDDEGVAVPAVVGPALDGASGRALVSDTDAGRLDGDTTYDRAVGPLQFVPTTWSVVGVDADGDGRRDPQDVDDAALATAVYLCTGVGDLAVPADLRSAVRRYNHSAQYVALVLEIMDAYAAGVPVRTVAAGYGVPAAGDTPVEAAADAQGHPSSKGKQPGHHAVTPSADASGPAPAQPADQPTAQQPATPPAGSPVRTLLSRTQAIVQCTLRGLTRLASPAAFAACVDELSGEGDAPD
ncbi:hypothetical protein GCM10022263_15760 [Nocardioides daeguensis]|uniref:Transglycosylase SLT domain-containing protein n=2 Tax=Nocardioides daeguensis TaxID=908359 RepID=A0ABP6V6J5_9ACTN